MNIKSGLIFSALVLFLYLGWDVLTGRSHSDVDSPASPNLKEKQLGAKEVEQIVNRHLVTTSKLIEMQKLQREFDLNNPDRLKPNTNAEKDKSLVKNDNLAERPAKAKVVKKDLGGLILEDSAREQMQRYEKYQEQQAYIRQFKENAWNGGVYVEVDEDGQVTKARPLTEREKSLPFSDEE